MSLEGLFKNKKVYSSPHGSSALFSRYFILFIVLVMDALWLTLVFISDLEPASLFFLVGISQIMMLVILFVLIKSLLFMTYVKGLIRKRSYLTASQLKSHSKISQSVVFYELAGAKLQKIKVIKEGSFWQLYDVAFDVYGQGRANKEKVQRAYYTVFEAGFKRMTPHVVFDSVSAKKKQFRHLYLSSQKAALGAGFDRHFETYVPQHYNLDALSFITPEVMTKMIDIKDCDIEFLQGNMLCYAPFLNEEQLEAFLTGCLALHKTTNHNLSSYRDSWLKKGEEVTEFGKQLLKNPRRILWTALFFVAVLIISILLNPEDALSDPLNWFFVITIGSNIVFYVNMLRENKKKEADFRKRVLDSKGAEIKTASKHDSL